MSTGCLEMQGLAYGASTGIAPRNWVDQRETAALFGHSEWGGLSLSFKRTVIWQGQYEGEVGFN